MSPRNSSGLSTFGNIHTETVLVSASTLITCRISRKLDFYSINQIQICYGPMAKWTFRLAARILSSRKLEPNDESIEFPQFSYFLIPVPLFSSSFFFNYQDMLGAKPSESWNMFAFQLVAYNKHMQVFGFLRSGVFSLSLFVCPFLPLHDIHTKKSRNWLRFFLSKSWILGFIEFNELDSAHKPHSVIVHRMNASTLDNEKWNALFRELFGQGQFIFRPTRSNSS